MKNSWLILILVIISFLVGRYLAPKKETTAEMVSNTENIELQTQLTNVRNSYEALRKNYAEVQEELNNRTESWRQREAQLLAKMEAAPSHQKTKSETPNNSQNSPQEQPQDQTSEDHVSKDSPATTTQNDALKVTSTPGEEYSSLSILENQLPKSNSPKEQKSFLKRARIDHAMQTADLMKKVSPRDQYYGEIMGLFKGTLRFDDAKRKKGKIAMQIRDPQLTEKSKAWAVRIDVDDGKTKASRHQGGLDMLRSLSDKSKTFFLRSSETSYLQLFIQPQQDQFIGNYYEKNKSGKYPSRGTFVLKRVEN